MKKYIGSLLLSAALMAPAVIQAEDHRYYDRDRKDYHQWNDNENRAYNRYREERRDDRKREFRQVNRNQQRDYWRWRHEHSDSILFPR